METTEKWSPFFVINRVKRGNRMSLYFDFVTANRLAKDESAINNAIRNILNTPVGSLPGKPTFGSRIQELVFAQMDDLTLTLLRKVIIEALDYWELRIKVLDVVITTDEAYNKMVATIYYQYKDEDKKSELTLGIQY